MADIHEFPLLSTSNPRSVVVVNAGEYTLLGNAYWEIDNPEHRELTRALANMAFGTLDNKWRQRSFGTWSATFTEDSGKVGALAILNPVYEGLSLSRQTRLLGKIARGVNSSLLVFGSPYRLAEKLPDDDSAH